MRQSEALIMVARAQAIWPQRDLSENTVNEYISGIQDLSVEVAGAALESLKSSLRFMPSIAEFRAAASEIDTNQTIPDADRAWQEIREQIRAVGSKRGMLNFSTNEPWEPAWSHPAVGQVADAMGWDSLCNSTTEMADRAHFLRLYEQISNREKHQARLTPFGHELAGLAQKLQLKEAQPFKPEIVS